MRHAVLRAIERGIRSVDPKTLVNAIEWEVRNRPDTSELVERVMPSGNDSDPDASVWRFRVEEGSFYAVVSGKGRVVTILTQDMIRAMKALKHGRDAIICELNVDYTKLMSDRIAAISGRRVHLLPPGL